MLEIKVKSILNSKKRDNWFLDDYTLNLYSGCTFNCSYCYIRGSKFGLNLEEKISLKKNALELLDKKLFNLAKKEKYGFITLSSITDPYLPIDKNYGMTTEALKLILKYKFPVHIITKSNLVVDDFDLLKKIDKTAILPRDLLNKINRGVIISFSFSTLDDKLNRFFESGAVLPSHRKQAVILTSKEGFFSGISLMPLLPYIHDSEKQLKEIYSEFKQIGVKFILPAQITLQGENEFDNKQIVFNLIEKHFPELKEKYVQLFKTPQLPFFIQNEFKIKLKKIISEFKIPDSILFASSEDLKILNQYLF